MRQAGEDQISSATRAIMTRSSAGIMDQQDVTSRPISYKG